MVTHNWRDPDFSNPDRVHDWLNYASFKLAGIWQTFSDDLLLLIAANLQDVADKEEWD